jgi:hypothetical protein
MDNWRSCQQLNGPRPKGDADRYQLGKDDNGCGLPRQVRTVSYSLGWRIGLEVGIEGPEMRPVSGHHIIRTRAMDVVRSLGGDGLVYFDVMSGDAWHNSNLGPRGTSGSVAWHHTAIGATSRRRLRQQFLT